MKKFRLFVPVFLLCLLVVGFGVCCSGERELNIHLYYQKALLSDLQKLAIKKGFARNDFAPDKLRYFLTLQTGGKPPQREVLKNENKTSFRIQFDPITCVQKSSKKNLQDFLYIEGFSKKQDPQKDEPRVIGRFPFFVACATGKARIQIVLPDSFQKWSSFHDERKELKEGHGRHQIKRIGHQVTTLPDGRLLITGGVRRLELSKVFSSENAFGNSTNFVKTVNIYDPSTGYLQTLLKKEGGRALTTLPRAFHSVTVFQRKDKVEVVLLGGVSLSKKLAVPEVITLDLVKKEAMWKPTVPSELKKAAEIPRAFHSVIEINGKYVVVGGIVTHPEVMSLKTEFEKNKNILKTDRFYQLLFFQVSKVKYKGIDMFLVSGGQAPIFDGTTVRWITVKKAWLLGESDLQKAMTGDGSLSLLKKSGQELAFARAGHVAVVLPNSEILLYGGFSGGRSPVGDKSSKIQLPMSILKIGECQGSKGFCFKEHQVNASINAEKKAYPTPVRLFARGAALQYHTSADPENFESHVVISGGLSALPKQITLSSYARNSISIHVTADKNFFQIRQLRQKPRCLHHLLVTNDGRFIASGGILGMLMFSDHGELKEEQIVTEVFVPSAISNKSSIRFPKIEHRSEELYRDAGSEEQSEERIETLKPPEISEPPEPPPVSLKPTQCNTKNSNEGLFKKCGKGKVCVLGICYKKCKEEDSDCDGPGEVKYKCRETPEKSVRVCVRPCTDSSKCSEGTTCFFIGKPANRYCLPGGVVSREYGICKTPRGERLLRCERTKKLTCLSLEGWKQGKNRVGKLQRCVRVCDPKNKDKDCEFGGKRRKCVPNNKSFLGGVCNGLLGREGALCKHDPVIQSSELYVACVQKLKCLPVVERCAKVCDAGNPCSNGRSCSYGFCSPILGEPGTPCVPSKPRPRPRIPACYSNSLCVSNLCVPKCKRAPPRCPKGLLCVGSLCQ